MIETPRIGLWVLIALFALGCGQRTASPTSSGDGPEAPAEAAPEATPAPADTDAAPQKVVSDTPELDPHAPMGPPFTDAEKATQLRCQKRSDCVLVKGVCSGWTPVNRENAERVRQRNQQMAARAKCSTRVTPPAVPECRDGECQVVELEWPDLRGCEAPSDCVAIKGVCSGWNVVAKSHQAEAEQRVAKLATVVRCKATTPEPAPSPVCRGGFCVPH